MCKRKVTTSRLRIPQSNPFLFDCRDSSQIPTLGMWVYSLCGGSLQICWWKKLLHQARKAWCTNRKERPNFRRSCDMGMRSARSGDSPSVGTCETNHRGIQGNFWVQCTRVKTCTEEHTLTKRQNWGWLNDSGLRMVNWESQSKTPPESRRQTHLLYYTKTHLWLARRRNKENQVLEPGWEGRKKVFG